MSNFLFWYSWYRLKKRKLKWGFVWSSHSMAILPSRQKNTSCWCRLGLPWSSFSFLSFTSDKGLSESSRQLEDKRTRNTLWNLVVEQGKSTEQLARGHGTECKKISLMTERKYILYKWAFKTKSWVIQTRRRDIWVESVPDNKKNY